MQKTNRNSILTIGYSVLADRLKNINVPLFEIPVDVIISVQNPTAINYEKNPKYKYIESHGVGVTKSRNLVLQKCESTFLLFADDDVIFLGDGIRKCLDYLVANPEIDLILSQSVDFDGLPRKKYKKRIHKLNKFNSAKAGTVEILIRKNSSKFENLHFDENFGAGAQNFIGDEYIFITDLMKLGGKAIFMPVSTVVHSVSSSGDNWRTRESLNARAQVFSRVFGTSAPFFRFLFYVKNFSSSPGFNGLLRFIFAKY